MKPGRASVRRESRATRSGRPHGGPPGRAGAATRLRGRRGVCRPGRRSARGGRQLPGRRAARGCAWPQEAGPEGVGGGSGGRWGHPRTPGPRDRGSEDNARRAEGSAVVLGAGGEQHPGGGCRERAAEALRRPASSRSLSCRPFGAGGLGGLGAALQGRLHQGPAAGVCPTGRLSPGSHVLDCEVATLDAATSSPRWHAVSGAKPWSAPRRLPAAPRAPPYGRPWPPHPAAARAGLAATAGCRAPEPGLVLPPPLVSGRSRRCWGRGPETRPLPGRLPAPRRPFAQTRP